MSFYDTSTKLTRHGKPLKCRCGGEIFTVRYVHNPYGSDMCSDDARCDACGTTYREYVGKFEAAPELPAQGSQS